MKPFNFAIMGYNRGGTTKNFPLIGGLPLKKIMDPVTEAEKIVEDYVRALRGEATNPPHRRSVLPAALVVFGMMALLGGTIAVFIPHGG